ncbi:hypothetical protein KEM52_003300 [Ascosphaera acerosa]|nr:hypothetical protein KEM52_003300 [Ascosphaera acerosa]
MASVSNLDQDLKGLRLSRYTPAATAEARRWIEGVLHESLPAGDLLDVLKDGTVLCRLINAVLPPASSSSSTGALRFRASAMPFVQMENISQFLRACRSPPLSLQEHDVFLTVDLYERKDPAQVLQCLGAFSRRAHALSPARCPSVIGPRGGTGLTPQTTGSSAGEGGGGAGASRRPPSASSAAASPLSRTTLPPPAPRAAKPASLSSPVSTWSKPEDELVTQPAWNIHQYGYMGGANQATLGINFGARRGITTYADGPRVPTGAEKEAREQRARQERAGEEEAERRRRAQLDAEEQRAREEEERHWAAETRKLHASCT